jgi:biotin carboxyl carrier protein
MDFKIADSEEIIDGKLLYSTSDGSILVKISGKEYLVKLLKSGTDFFEFILDDSFHYAKILESHSSDIRISIDGNLMTLKKHSKLAEILEKSLSQGTARGGENSLVSQIPGRVVNVVKPSGSDVKKGDSVVILESMKMQVSVKAHKDGNIKDLRVKNGSIVGRNDIIAIID